MVHWLERAAGKSIARLAATASGKSPPGVIARFVARQPIRAGIVATGERAAARGDFRLAADCFALSALSRGMHRWQYESCAGTFHLLAGDRRTGCGELARGLAPSIQLLRFRAGAGLPAPFVRWFEENSSHFHDERFWEAQCANAWANGKPAPRLQLRLGLIAIALGRPRSARAILSPLVGVEPGDEALWALFFCHRLAGGGSARLPLIPIDDVTSPLGEARFAASVYNAIASAKAELASLPADEASRALQGASRLTPFETAPIQAIFGMVQAINRQDFRGAREIARAHLDDAAGFLRSLDDRAPVRKIFIGGFGWSGSSAVCDAIKGYPEIAEMPGAGQAQYLNAGADSEPMFLQGPSGLWTLWTDIVRRGRLRPDSLWGFFRVHVIGDPPHHYQELKATLATRDLRRRLGDRHPILVIQLLDGLAAALGAGSGRQRRKRSLAAFRRYVDSLVKLLTGERHRFALFNNAVNATFVYKMQIVADAVFLAVTRDARDQFADQKRLNRFFKIDASLFVWRAIGIRILFALGRTILRIRHRELRVYSIVFENWVRDSSFRAHTVSQIIGRHSQDCESKHFDDRASAKNIQIYKQVLSDQELQKFRLPLLARVIQGA